MTDNDESVPTHSRQETLDDYEQKSLIYQEVKSAVLSILERVLPNKIVIATTARIKDFDSFYEKANRLEEGKLKYPRPFEQIHDIVGLRVVVLAQRNVSEVCHIIKKTLQVVEEEDKAAQLLEKGQLGYESYHLICKLGSDRVKLEEYHDLCDQLFEIQVRTALQHAWAENEHRIQYKKAKNPELRKRFLRLAAAISSADEEFDRIYEINERLEENAIAAAEESSNPENKYQDDSEENDAQLSQISLLFGKKPSQLTAEGHYTEAQQVYDRFIAIQPTQVTHYVGRAKVRAIAGDIEGGLTDLTTARTLSPDHQATKALGKFFERLLKDVDQQKSS